MSVLFRKLNTSLFFVLHRALKLISYTLVILGLTFSRAGFAGDSLTADQEDNVRQFKAALGEAIVGAQTLTLQNEAHLDITADYVYLPRKPGEAFMRALGNAVDENFVGVILPKMKNIPWFVTIYFYKTGFIDDKAMRNCNSQCFMNMLKSATAKENAVQESQHSALVQVQHWVDAPVYNEKHHQLHWSIQATEGDREGAIINDNTYFLGREGYLQFSLVAPIVVATNAQTNLSGLLSTLAFNKGKRYEDFAINLDLRAAQGVSMLLARREPEGV